MKPIFSYLITSILLYIHEYSSTDEGLSIKEVHLMDKRMTGLSIKVRQAPAPPCVGKLWASIKLLADASYAELVAGKTQGHADLSWLAQLADDLPK